MTDALVTQLLVDLQELPERARQGVLQEENRRLQDTSGAGQRRVLIIGGAGYIGAPVTSALLQGGANVRVLDNNTYLHADAVVGYLPHPNYEYVHGDMGDAATLDAALSGVTDVIILGGLVGDPITKKFPDEAHAINDVAMLSCIDQLNGKGLNKVIFVSTCSNYGLIKEDEKAHEEFELSPLSLYAKSKVAAEQYILSKRGAVDYHPTVLRFATAFGLAPRMRFDLTVNEFTRDLAIGNELVVFDAHTWRPYCHVKDFARLIRRVFAYPADAVAFQVFNAGGDKNNHTKQSIVDLITAQVPDARVSYKANSSDPRNYRVDFAKVRSVLDFEPAFSVEDGIQEIIWALNVG
ncbi:MAG: NAD(P)-dependent oxidoreductase, partial [Pseudomonadota bacterium]